MSMTIVLQTLADARDKIAASRSACTEEEGKLWDDYDRSIAMIMAENLCKTQLVQLVEQVMLYQDALNKEAKANMAWENARANYRDASVEATTYTQAAIRASALSSHINKLTKEIASDLARREELVQRYKLNRAGVDGWPDDWKRNGYNNVLLQASQALSYLAEKPRPGGGEARFNSEHLHQLAREIQMTQEMLLGVPFKGKAPAP